MEDKRRFERKHLVDYLRVFDRNSDQLMGYLIDITHNGLMLVSKNKIVQDSILQLKVVLSEHDEGKIPDKQINLDVKSKWCKKSSVSGFYDIGFEMLFITIEDLQVLMTKLI